MIGNEAISIVTGDVRLAGTLFRVNEPTAVVVLHGATGVPHRYYASFAAYVAERYRVNVLTYDYRDFAESSTGPVAQSKATMGDWGVVDQSSATDWAISMHPGLPLDVIGHSLGGMMMPFHKQSNRIRRAIVVASGPAHFLTHPLRVTPLIFFLWFFAGPISARVLGYVPGRLMGMRSDLPSGVFEQWRRWCLSRNFYVVDYARALPQPNPENITCPIDFVAIEDDTFITPRNVEALRAFYPNALTTYRVVGPQNVQAAKIGHITGFSRHNIKLWPNLLASWK